MPRLSLREIFLMNAYWLGMSFKWNTLHVLLLPAMLLQYSPETQKNTYLGLLTFIGLLIAMLVQPLAGALSDRWRSRWGRRRPLILLGTVFDLLFLALMGWAGGLPWLFAGYFGLQVSSNLAHGPAQGLIPDQAPPDQLGRASGIKNLMDMVGLAVAALWMGRLVDPQGANAGLPLALIAAVLALGAGLTLLGTRERSSLGLKLEKEPQAAEPASAPVPVVFWRLIASRFAFLLGIYGIQAFAQYYVRDVLQVSNPVQVTGDLLAALTLALIAAAVGGGWLGDRVGHVRMLWAASLLAGLGCVLLLLARTPAALLLYGSVLGMGTGLFLTSNWALASRLSPPEAAGKFLGLTNLATAGAGAASRLTGPAIDLLNSAQPGEHLGYTGLFLFGAVGALLSALLLLKIQAPTGQLAPAAEAGPGRG